MSHSLLHEEESQRWERWNSPHAFAPGSNAILPEPWTQIGETNASDQAEMRRWGLTLSDQSVPPEYWQSLEARWRAILGLEAGIESLRATLENVRAEMEAAFRKTLNVEEKVHALQADVAQWTKAKSRIHYALPKVREFIHRATWAQGIPERKKLEAIVKNHIEPQIPFAELDQVPDQLDFLQKDRQVLTGQGNSVLQECRVICAEIQRALSTLQRNAATRARAQRDTKREKGKYF